MGGLAIIVICLTNGWHLVPIQAFAWFSMAVENSDSYNFTEALSSAMEGKEICGICQYVIEQKTNTDDQEIGYWNVIPKWLLAVPSIAKFLISPPQEWNRVNQQTSDKGDTNIRLELPPPKQLVIS